MNDLTTMLKQARRSDVAEHASAVASSFSDTAAGSGMVDVAYTTMELPVGEVLVAATPRGLVRIAYGDFWDAEEALNDLAARISPRVLEVPSYFDGVRSELDEYFAGKRTSFDLPIDWSLTGGFTRKVLKHTAKIPYGEVSTYRDMAAAAGSPRGARAAGNALGANPIPIVVPCHRVLHSGGGLGGYGGGLEYKKLLLELEGAL
ncbi:MAG: methylated-DNA--[protein]-cysteine S-methyltransferase [Solirubrobacterales bacterium]